MADFQVRVNSNNEVIINQYTIYSEFNQKYPDISPATAIYRKIISVDGLAQIQTNPQVIGGFGGASTKDFIGFKFEEGVTEATISVPKVGGGRKTLTIEVLPYDPEAPLYYATQVYDFSSNTLDPSLDQNLEIEPGSFGSYSIQNNDEFSLVTSSNPLSLEGDVGDIQFSRLFKSLGDTSFPGIYDPQGDRMTLTNIQGTDDFEVIGVDYESQTVSVKLLRDGDFSDTTGKLTFDITDPDGNLFKSADVNFSYTVNSENITRTPFARENLTNLTPATFDSELSFTDKELESVFSTLTDINGNTQISWLRNIIFTDSQGNFIPKILVNESGPEPLFQYRDDPTRARYTLDELKELGQLGFYSTREFFSNGTEFIDTYSFVGLDSISKLNVRANFDPSSVTGELSTFDVDFDIEIYQNDGSYLKADDPGLRDYIQQNGSGFYRLVDGYVVPVDQSDITGELDLVDLYYCEVGSDSFVSVDPSFPPVEIPNADGTIPDVLEPTRPPIIDDTFESICGCVDEVPGIVMRGVEGVDYIYGQFQENDTNNYMNRRGFTDNGDYWIKGKNSSDELIGNGQEIAFVAGSSDVITGSDVSTTDILDGLADGTIVSTKSFTSYDGIFNVATFKEGTLTDLLASGEVGITRIDAETGEQLGGSTVLDPTKEFTNFDSAYGDSLSAQNGFSYADVLA